jgi:hypothetical protein
MSDEREIQQVMARYVRAADRRDGAAMSELFLPEGKVEIFYNNAGKPEFLGELVGPQAIGGAVGSHFDVRIQFEQNQCFMLSHFS